MEKYTIGISSSFHGELEELQALALWRERFGQKFALPEIN